MNPPFLRGGRSPSSRRAWIEIDHERRYAHRRSVALLAEGVDRNLLSTIVRTSWRVALLAEGVDRNMLPKAPTVGSSVALLAEGVDRNLLLAAYRPGISESPSSRRAWIEIVWNWTKRTATSVALLAEGVDRNSAGISAVMSAIRRPPRGGRG